MKKRIAKLFIITSVLVLLCSCVKIDKTDIFGTTEKYTYQTLPATTQNTYETQSWDATDNYQSPGNDITGSTVNNSQPEQSSPVSENQQTTVSETTENADETTEKTYEKTGEMAFSDNADNKYIKAIVNKYGVNAQYLAAIYTVPENDGNIVLEFDGTTDSNGKLIRNKDTLISIYSIDKNLNSQRASETLSLNEYSYGEMKVMFITTTKYIMPEFEAELNG